MFLQNLRARLGARLSGDGEAGFTLIELLVVMLILGILAAIALPAFFNQREKAGDANAKETAHSAQVAVETYATENGGSYLGVTEEKLHEIEPTLPKVAKNGEEKETQAVNVAVLENGKGYEVIVTSTTGTKFKIVNKSGTMSFPCELEGNAAGAKGGCPSSHNWGNE